MQTPLNPQLVSTLIGLADEGVPVRALSRASKVPWEELRRVLDEARDHGKLIELPTDDWQRLSREDRAKLGSERRVSNEDVLSIFRNEFRLTRGQAVVLTALYVRGKQTKRQLHDCYENWRICTPDATKNSREPTHEKIVDVIICGIRKKLKPYGITIYTSWGDGYGMLPEQRALLGSVVDKHTSGVP